MMSQSPHNEIAAEFAAKVAATLSPAGAGSSHTPQQPHRPPSEPSAAQRMQPQHYPSSLETSHVNVMPPRMMEGGMVMPQDQPQQPVRIAQPGMAPPTVPIAIPANMPHAHSHRTRSSTPPNSVEAMHMNPPAVMDSEAMGLVIESIEQPPLNSEIVEPQGLSQGDMTHMHPIQQQTHFTPNVQPQIHPLQHQLNQEPVHQLPPQVSINQPLPQQGLVNQQPAHMSVSPQVTVNQPQQPLMVNQPPPKMVANQPLQQMAANQPPQHILANQPPPQIPVNQPPPQVTANQPPQMPTNQPPQMPTNQPPQMPANQPPQMPANQPPQMPANQPPPKVPANQPPPPQMPANQPPPKVPANQPPPPMVVNQPPPHIPVNQPPPPPVSEIGQQAPVPTPIVQTEKVPDALQRQPEPVMKKQSEPVVKKQTESMVKKSEPVVKKSEPVVQQPQAEPAKPVPVKDKTPPPPISSEQSRGEPVSVSVEKVVSQSRTSSEASDSVKQDSVDKREKTPELNVLPPTPVEKEAKTEVQKTAPSSQTSEPVKEVTG